MNIVASIIFSGMSGSALADAAGPGKLEVDMMVKAGYEPGFSAALSTTSAIIGPIIPPSIPMVLFGVVSNTSIGYLFMGGVIPGLLLGLAQMGVVFWLARKRDFPIEPPQTLRTAVRTTLDAAPALTLPFIMLGGIYSGAVTPTEAAAVCAFIALILAFLWYRSPDLRGLFAVLVESRATAVVTVTIAGALVMNWIVAAERIPDALGAWMVSLASPNMFMFVVTVLFSCSAPFSYAPDVAIIADPDADQVIHLRLILGILGSFRGQYDDWLLRRGWRAGLPHCRRVGIKVADISAELGRFLSCSPLCFRLGLCAKSPYCCHANGLRALRPMN